MKKSYFMTMMIFLRHLTWNCPGTDFLKLMPKCINGLECKSCENCFCFYRSRFWLGWVLVGKCNNIGFNNINSTLAKGNIFY